MKQLFVVILVCTFTLYLPAQGEKAVEKKLQIDLGYVYMSNDLNGDYYYDFQYGGAPDSKVATMGGGNLKFTLQTKNKHIDLISGTIFLVGRDSYGSRGWAPGNTNSTDYLLNGGGVYAGISPKIKGKHIGLTTDLAIGVFSFKEYITIFNNISAPFMDVHDKRTSYGLGAMSSVGFYVRYWKIGLNPSVNAIFSGGANASFLFYGFVLPVTYQF